MKRKIAINYEPEDEFIFSRFGEFNIFKFYETENGEVTSEEVKTLDENEMRELAACLKKNGVDAVICENIDGDVFSALSMMGMKVYSGIRGYADAAVMALNMGVLVFNSGRSEAGNGGCRCNHSDSEGAESGCCCDHSGGECGCGSPEAGGGSCCCADRD